jgi:hypothetical protein
MVASAGRLRGWRVSTCADPSRRFGSCGGRELGFVGLRLVPWLWELSPTDRLYYPLYAACVGHTGPLRPSETGRPIPRNRLIAAKADEVSDGEISRTAGGTSHEGTHRPLLRNLRVDEAAALPSPAVVLSVRLDQYYGRLRRRPGQRPLPGSSPVIGRRAPVNIRNHRAGDGLPSSRRHLLNVPRPLRRGVPHGCTPGSSPLPWPSP